jgi:AcrR family transcriptional regulator
MPRPVSIHDEAILDAASKVFLAHGYQASTAKIARRAGVSEGSLFKRFRTKTELFLAAMSVQSREQERQESLMAGVGTAPIRPTLEDYGRHLLTHLQIVLPRILMVTSSGVRFAKNYLPTRCPPPLQHVAVLTRYLRAETRCGRLVLANPEIHADVFVGALSHCVFCETVFGRRVASHAAYIRTLVDHILWAGEPATDGTVPSKRTRGQPKGNRPRQGVPSR